MGSDKARISYDPAQQYRAVVMQQGRVTVEADWNEAQEIVNEAIRADVLDIVGPAGTPDPDGYKVTLIGPGAGKLYDLHVAPGTMYVGGVRVHLDDPGVDYSKQSEWLDHTDDPDWVDPATLLQKVPSSDEFVYLALREQEVSAVEDSDLLEVALGGPDTAARTRLLQRIVRLKTDTTDCTTSLDEAVLHWAQNGLDFDPATMRLNSRARLQVGFLDPGSKPDPCQPQAKGGYLYPENQLIRVQISHVDGASGIYKLLWGFDNASALYPIQIGNDKKTVMLRMPPVDVAHRPVKNQTVEILRSAAQLHNGNYVASAAGFVTPLAEGYTPDAMTVVLADSFPGTIPTSPDDPPLFLRVWQEELTFQPGKPVTLGDTGLQITLTFDTIHKSGPFHAGDYWQIAARPNHPDDVYPHRYLHAPQPPDGPRLWICPLATIQWQGRTGEVRDCRNYFENLVTLTRRKTTGCCTLSLSPADLNGDRSLQKILDRYVHRDRVTICLQPGVYELTEPLRLGAEHSNLTLEGCHDGVVLQVKAGREDHFLDGMIVLNHADQVTIRSVRFELPLVPIARSGGKLASTNLLFNDTALAREFRALRNDPYYSSIGIRSLHCAQLTVEGCLFRYHVGGMKQTPSGPQPLGEIKNLFAVGIFANSECHGLTIQRNRFLHEEEYLRDEARSHCQLMGFLLTPTLVAKNISINISTNTSASTSTNISTNKSANASTLNAAATVAVSHVVHPLLDNALFRDNEFAGLTAATLIYSHCGTVTFEDNRVHDCLQGFWLLSLQTLAYTDLLPQVKKRSDGANEVTAKEVTAKEALSVLALVTDPTIRVASVLARTFPLPKEFDLKHWLLKEERPLNLSLAQLQSEILERARQEMKLNLSATAGRQVFLSLAAFEREVLSQKLRTGLPLHLRFAGNQIDAIVKEKGHPDVSHGSALVIWDDPGDTGSTLIMNDNRLRNEANLFPTVAVISVNSSVITGNLIENSVSNADLGYSLIIDVENAGKQAPVTVSGNLLKGTSSLPNLHRPFSSPLDTWLFANTQL